MRVVALLAVLLAGCAQSPIKTAWLPPDQDLWHQNAATRINLKRQDRTLVKWIAPVVIKNLLEVKGRLETVSATYADLAIVETESPNAFAFVDNRGKNVVAFSISFL